MKRDGHENTSFFIGPEVEHTPAFSKKTLFVVGEQDLDRILELTREHKTPHVFMGANHSFSATDAGEYWDKTITALLDRGYWVSLDYEAHEHLHVLSLLSSGVWQSRLFVPMLNVRIPHVQTSSQNLTIKIDDVDFKATNPGVWCMNFHEVTDSNRFTDWQEYGSDVVIEDDKPTPMPPYYSQIPDPALKVNVKDLKELKPATILNARVSIDGTESAVVTEEVKNDGSLGLDLKQTTSLKPDTEAEIPVPTNLTAIDAAAAYAEGAKEDPLGKEGSKKKAKK